MPSNVTNRKTIREALAALMTAGLDGPTWSVYNYGTAIFDGKYRNLVIGSSDTDYPQQGASANLVAASDAEFDFNICIFIRYADDANGWTPQNSEDALDLGRKQVTDIVRDNRKTNNWERLKFNGKSAVGVAPDEAGVPYRYEIIPVRVTILS